MLQHEIDSENGIMTVTPAGELTADDFKHLTDVIDDYTTRKGPLQALLIAAEDFPGWDSFGSLFQHLKLIRTQRNQLKKVAAATDSTFLSVMPHIIDHFVQAEVRHFDYAAKEQALEWLKS